MRFLLRLPVPWVYILGYLLGVCIGLVFPLYVPATVAPNTTLAAGATLFALGALIAGWGWVTFHIARTTRVPGERSTQLVTWGPYRFTRNPMYAGLALAYVGEAALLRQVWPVVLLPLVLAYVNSVVIPLEQTRLSEVFGDSYEQYMRRVRRWV
jgi:protein-S-isoprenylcysteine O-methyltransferase Ste14